ncbi:hypothetical protein IV203_029052 [Nitzschia inconspicua]|uniref:Uncharacterized protein n=1 Tax=Nitzschia inconspicua TaxID=303405 RepID=A0A9K3LQF5_9STRA|nr:hypothetical protein IV203_029052 [Nitzschia inconspicua]
MENLMNQIPQNIMKAHDPNDDPFAALSDDSNNQLQSPLEYGSGISYFVQSEQNEGKEEHSVKDEPSHSSIEDDKTVDEVANGGEKEEDKKEE